MENDDELKNITLEGLLYLEYMKGDITEETYYDHSKLKEWWDNLDEWEKQQIILNDYKFGNSKIESHEQQEWE